MNTKFVVKPIRIIGMVFLALLLGCSTSTESSNALKFDNMWRLKASNAVWYIFEVENVGTKPVKAFQGTFSLLDDFNKVLSPGLPVQFGSSTPYVSNDANNTPHTIARGEHICICIAVLENEPEKVYAFAKSDILKAVIPGGITQKDLDDSLTDRKFVFTFEKIAYAE